MHTVFHLPFVVLLLKVTFDAVPHELREAALVDGASEARTLRSVMLPVAAPGIAAAVIFAAILSWNDYLLGLTLTSGPEAAPLTVGIGTFVQPFNVRYGEMTAAGTLAALPIVLLAVFAHRYIVSGLTGVDGIDARIVDFGYQVLLGNGGRRPSREQELLAAFAGLRIEGLILLAPVVSQRVLRDAAAAQPLVVVSRPDVHVAGVDTVINDEAHGVQLAVDHLVALGHVDIAHIAGAGSAAPERRQGYQQAMHDRGLEDHVRVVPGGYAEADGYEGARVLLDAPRPPTAVIVANDLAAMGTLTALAEAGLRVPEDISVVGYDNTLLASLSHISLTSVNQPRQEMGRLAAQMLHDRIEGRRTRARRHVVTPTLVSRRSTGPVPQS